jgi:hypothetical protein
MNLPRGYLSYSQLILWEKNPRQYELEYMRGGESADNDAMRYGRKVDKDIENGESDDEMTKHLLIYLPSYQFRQYEARATIKVDGDEVILLGKYDGFDPEFAIPKIGDYKTGMVKWTQKRADESDQLTFYDLLLWIREKRQAELFIHWMPTERGEDGEIRTTGEVRNFKTSRKLVDLLKMQARAAKAAREISVRYEEVINNVFR